MRMLVSTALAAALALTLPACNQEAADTDTNAATAETGSLEALNGNFKADPASLKIEGKPDEYLLKDGTYECKTCVPPLTIAADGQMHAVADRPYFDEMSVRLVDDKTVETRRNKGGREVGVVTSTVSDDGQTLTTKFVNKNNADAPYEGTVTATRAGPAPEGAHAMSGQWVPDKVQEFTEEALDNRYSVQGDTVSWSGQSQSYTAQLGGPAVPIEGDTGGTMVKVERGDNGALREIYMRGGKEVGVATASVSADGQTLTYVYEDKEDGSTATWTGNKTS